MSPSAAAAASTASSSARSLVAMATPTARSPVAGTTVATARRVALECRSLAADLENGSFGGRIDLEGRPVRARQRSSPAEQVVDRVVVTLGVMVEQHEPPDAGRTGQA